MSSWGTTMSSGSPILNKVRTGEECWRVGGGGASVVTIEAVMMGVV